MISRVLSSLRTTSPPLHHLVRARQVSSLPPLFCHTAAVGLVRKMRDARIAAANISDKSELERAVEASMHNFLFLANSNQRSKLDALDAIGLIKLCRKSAQPSHIANIWPHIQQLSLLPAKDDRTTCTLIGSVVSSALEAKDTSTAASVWSYLRSLRSYPLLPLGDAHFTQLLCALRGRPDLVVELITALQEGTLSVRADVKHFGAALQSLTYAPEEFKRVFELARKHKQVNAVTLVVWCQALQQHHDLAGALDTLSAADFMSIVPVPAHYTVLLSCAAKMKSLESTKHIHRHLSDHAAAKRDIIVNGALVHSYAQCGDLDCCVCLTPRCSRLWP